MTRVVKIEKTGGPEVLKFKTIELDKPNTEEVLFESGLISNNTSDLDIENDSGVYVILDKFHVEVPAIVKSGYSSTLDPYCLKTLKETIEQAGIKFPKHNYAFKVAQRSKIENKDGWVELHTWAKQQLEAIIQSGNLNQAWIDIQKIDDLN